MWPKNFLTFFQDDVGHNFDLNYGLSMYMASSVIIQQRMYINVSFDSFEISGESNRRSFKPKSKKL